MLGIELYLWPIVAYVFLYAIVYLAPFLWTVFTSTLGSDIHELSRRIEMEVETEKKRHTAGPDGTSAAASDADEVDEEPPEDASPDAGVAPEAEADRAPSKEEFRSRTLETTYASPIVAQAVKQLRTKYPHGDFRTFEMERMPAYARYDERLTAARNMAGLFVLFGLLGTMIKLNQIVSQIGAAAGAGQMGATQFLDNMGSIMSNIGGAFDSSIWGLALMVLALVAIGLLDRWMQRRLDRLDHVIQGTLIPGLSDLQLMRIPTLSIGDLIDETSGLLTNLNSSVEGMTAGINESIGELSDEINKMMQDFGSFQNQYAQLNDLINNLKAYTENVEDVTAAIEGAGHTLANPISEMNRDLNNTIREHMGVVGEAIQASEANRDALVNEFQRLEGDLNHLTTQLRDIATDTLEHVEQHQRELGQTIESHQEAQAAAIEDELERLQAQSASIQDELRATAEALEAANSQELTELLDALDDRLADSAGGLSSSAGQLTGSAQRIAESADRLHRATQGLETRKAGPVTLFDWVRRTVEEKANGQG
jgi:NTP pyrophosphatase (non-canonical NTP hydrolase)